ncbi:ArsR family transcriptional regulator [Mycobacterium sp. E3251]|uniref:ArsR family transcriptional regulator n=1 Tax=Mycobacterium sp. E3251 TaxID=1834144 RepID=UPI0012E7DB22|nr:ArsR family transcriptional regulator [Mycobacterium sp. E3251]
MALADDPDVGELSRVLFGQTHRLAVMLGIARGPREFALSELAEELGYKNLSSIQDPVRDLEKSHLITRLPKVANKVRFRRNASLAWRWAKELGESLSA